MLASIALACSFLVTPQARTGLRPVGLRMCEEPELPGTPEAAEPATGMSLITELAENRMAGMSKWDEMSQAFAAAAGCEWEAAEALGAQKDWETAEIDLEQFTALLVSQGSIFTAARIRRTPIVVERLHGAFKVIPRAPT